MRTIVHLSDLHFGRVDPVLPPALLAAVAEVGPDLVVVSGDFTQRARVREFKEAARFLAALPGPLLLVPGNHDVPLYDVLRRWLSPLGRYRRFITDELAPVYRDAEMAVLGVNTARALTFKNGRINGAQIAAVVGGFAGLGADVLRVVVTHHPFDAAPTGSTGVVALDHVLGRGDVALAALLAARVDLILSGHLHVSRVAQTAGVGVAGRSALLIQAGTSTSTRQRGQVNAFNVVRIERPAVGVTCMVWAPGEGRFRPGAPERYVETETGWVRS